MTICPAISAFGMPVKKHLDGSFSAEQEFASKDEAKAYLKSRAHSWYDSHNTTDDELSEMLDQIGKYESLTLDAVTASIEED